MTYRPGNGATVKIFSTGALTILGRVIWFCWQELKIFRTSNQCRKLSIWVTLFCIPSDVKPRKVTLRSTTRTSKNSSPVWILCMIILFQNKEGPFRKLFNYDDKNYKNYFFNTANYQKTGLGTLILSNFREFIKNCMFLETTVVLFTKTSQKPFSLIWKFSLWFKFLCRFIYKYLADSFFLP